MDVADKLPGWLGVTGQQFNIIEAISSLQKRGEETSPKAIIEEDASLRKGPKIQKSNFFSQLKALREKGLVKRMGEADYGVDFGAIRKALDGAQKRADKELYELKELRSKSEEYFKHLEFRKKEPVVKFFEYDEMYRKAADILKTSGVCYVTGIFPRILYAQSPSLMHTPGARVYAHTLWERCVSNKELQVNYLTHFDVDYLFKRLMETYGNPAAAYEEIKLILNGLKDFIRDNENLDLYYVDSPYGLDMIIPHNEFLDEFFLMVRNEDNRGLGAVYIDSPELAEKFKGLFEAECGRAVDMGGEKGEKVYGKLEKRLEKIYAKRKKK